MTDTEILDWLEKNPGFRTNKGKRGWVCTDFSNYPYEIYPTLREAVTAAAVQKGRSNE